MGLKVQNKSIYLLLLLLIAGFLHTIPLWNYRENLAAGYGDPLAHAAIGGWYCSNVLGVDFHSLQYLTPYGADVSGNYDSPFPFVLTCPFIQVGGIFQFHIFTLLQIMLIILSAWLVATRFLQGTALQASYILFVWWCGFYISRSHQHVTLLSMIWGLQFVFYALMNLKLREFGNVLGAGLLVGLAFTGTFQSIPVLFFITLALVIYKLYLDRAELRNKRNLLNLFSGVLLMLVVFFGFWWQMIYFTLKNGKVVVDSQRQLYNLDLISLFMPTESSRIYQWFGDLPKVALERQNSIDYFIFVVALISMFSKKFWKDSFRVLILVMSLVYLVLALGPELRIANEVISYLDFNSEIYKLLPLSITRTPGRMAMVTCLGFVLLAFMYLNQLKEGLGKRVLVYGSIVWILITGPAMNAMGFFPTLNYLSILPANALTEIRNMPPENIVVQIPSAWAQDPSANFLQLFHGKNITSGYLSYPVYNKEIADHFASDPFLGKLGCEGEITAFASNPLLQDAGNLRMYMLSRNMRAVVINKNILIGNPGCKNLLSWVQLFVKLPWVKVLEENSLFVIAVIQ